MKLKKINDIKYSLFFMIKNDHKYNEENDLNTNISTLIGGARDSEINTSKPNSIEDLEEWSKNPRPTILEMTEDDWSTLEADDDHDWMSRYKLPWGLYDLE